MTERPDARDWNERRTAVLCKADSWLAGSALVSALESQGIAAMFETSATRAYDGLFTLAEGAGRVLVFEDDRAEAEAIVSDYFQAQKEQKEDQQ